MNGNLDKLSRLWPIILTASGAIGAFFVVRSEFQHHRDLEGHPQLTAEFHQLEKEFEAHRATWDERWRTLQKESD